MARVDHLSYSAIITFLRNQVEFQKRYIAKVYDNAKTPALVVGTAFHKAMETYYTPEAQTMTDAARTQMSVEAGLKEIEITSDYEMEYGKTGSREKMIRDYTTLINKYLEEMKPIIVVDVERRMDHTINNVPMVGVIDLVERSAAGGLKLDDYKTVTAYSPEEEENYKYLLQGYIYLALAEKEYKEQVESVTFIEVKKTINRDGSPQSREYVYDRQSLLEFANVAHKIITNVYSYVNDDNAKFFPNPSDQINGMESMQIISNMEEGFDESKVKRKINAADKFAPRNITVDVGEDTGTAEEMILKKFIEFGIGGIMGKTYNGAAVILHTFKPNRGISMSSIAKRGDDLSIALKAKHVRIQAPIAGTDLVGIEIPNPDRRIIDLEDKHFKKGTAMIPLGEDVFGETHYGDLTKMPHLLIAGQTGSGKSVMLNVILKSLTTQMTPKELQLVLIDPKQVELTMYENDPHLRQPVITDPLEAAKALDNLVKLMNKRYTKLREAGVRSIEQYKGKDMPLVVAMVDEFADLMMTDTAPSINSMDYKALQHNVEQALWQSSTGKLTQGILREAIKQTIISTAPPSCEDSIIRIAQKARAVGIHLILATQRPSADVVTGLIKANIPTKIAFSVTTSMNSRIILDEVGAEALTGYGDMLYQDPRASSLQRLQGFFW